MGALIMNKDKVKILAYKTFEEFRESLDKMNLSS